jgi:hypothetical protein
MSIARVKGARHEVRCALARRSRELLERYRGGQDAAPDCPLAKALAIEVPPEGGSAIEVPPEVGPSPEAAATPGRQRARVTPRVEPARSAGADVEDERRARMEAVRARLRSR